MSKENNNIRSKKSNSSKPYDVSKSFVAKVASRVTELLPQRAWLNRWLAPADAEATATSSLMTTSTPLINSHPGLSGLQSQAQHPSTAISLDPHGPRPAKRPRLPHDNSPQFPSNKFLGNVSTHEEISPIGPLTSNDASDSTDGPSGAGQFNRKTTFRFEQPMATPSRTSSGIPRSSAGGTTITTKATIENIGKFNGGDDCSESSESTSGCSSLVPQAQSSSQARHSESRHHSFSGVTGGSLNGSLFPGRGNPKVDLTTLNRRRPSFNMTAFNTPSRLHNTSLQSSQASPFYSGRTMYGGASAYHSSASGLFAPSSRRAGVQVRPVSTANTSSTTALSSTAKRILDALEQFSTPVADAKRLPVTPGSKRKLERYAELTVPTTSDLLRVKRRERLQDSTCAARQASVSSSRPTSPVPLSTSVAAREPAEYRIRNDNEDSETQRTGKVTRKMEMEYETVPEVRLPPAVLPITSLPVIDINIPPPAPTAPTLALQKPVQMSSLEGMLQYNILFGGKKEVPPVGYFPSSSPLWVKMAKSADEMKTMTKSNQEFTFSDPSPAQIDKDSEKCKENKCGKACVDAEKFTFSEPCKWWCVNSSSNGNKNVINNRVSFGSTKVTTTMAVTSGEKVSLGSDKVSSKSVISKEPNVGPASVVVETQKTTDQEDIVCWKCSTCMIRNNKDSVNCLACNTPKTAPDNVTKSPLVFKPPPDTWECKECLIRNKNALKTCAACGSPKTKIAEKSPVPATTVSTTLTTPVAGFNSFGDKFKPPSDTWECKECFVRNKNSFTKCAACSSAKPNSSANVLPSPQLKEVKVQGTGFGNMFKNAEGSWECGTCMIRNDAKVNKCIACETLKPGAKEEKPAASSFKYGCDQRVTPVGGEAMFSFGNNNSLTSNAKTDSLTSSANFVFGSANSSAASAANPIFTFGMPPAAAASADNTTETSLKEKKAKPINDKITNPLHELAKLQEKQVADPSATFKFGAVNHTNSTKDSNTGNKNFVFGVSSTASKIEPASNKILDQNKTAPPGTFSFGSTTASSEKTDNAAKSFVFKPEVEKSQQAAVKTVNLFQNTTQQSEVKSAATEPTDPAETSSTPLFNTSVNKSSTLFMFGSGASNPSTSENNKTPVFGNAAAGSSQKQSLAAETVKLMFGSTANKTSSVFSNSSSEIKTPMFGLGNNETKSVLGASVTSSTTVPAFGTPTTTGTSIKTFGKDAQTTIASGFMSFNSTPSPFQSQIGTQAQQQQQQQLDKPSLFSMPAGNTGIQSTNSTSQAGGFTFGTAAAAPTEQPKPAGFTFSVQTAPATAGFSFGNPGAAPAQNFSFTPKENEQQQQQAAPFSFSSSQPAAATPATPAFGVQQQTPGFGEASTPFAFGAQTQQQPAQASAAQVFGFTAPQAPATAVPAPSTFVFGSANTTPQQAQQAQPAVATFDPNARPTFNFTGGSTPSFTATPNPLNAAGAPAPGAVRRVFKKAVRRTGQTPR